MTKASITASTGNRNEQFLRNDDRLNFKQMKMGLDIKVAFSIDDFGSCPTPPFHLTLFTLFFNINDIVSLSLEFGSCPISIR